MSTPRLRLAISSIAATALPIASDNLLISDTEVGVTVRSLITEDAEDLSSPRAVKTPSR
jgi:hypothetical protein